MNNSISVQQWHDRPVNGSTAGSWQTVHAEQYDGAPLDASDLEASEWGAGVFRLVVTDETGDTIMISETAQVGA